MLFAIDGFTCLEIAEHLGIPYGTVKSRLLRAREICAWAVRKLEFGALDS